MKQDSFWRKYCRNKLAVAGLVILALVVFISIFAPLISPYDVDAPADLTMRLKPPMYRDEATGNLYVLGTDHLGHDILTRLFYGARVSLVVGIASVLLGGGIGLVLGMVSGYFGGALDSVIMRFSEMQLSFPFLLLAMVLVSLLGSSILNVVVVLAVTSWITYAKVVRAEVLSLRQNEFVESCRALGGTVPHILRRHIIPNIIAPFVVIASSQVAAVIIAESTLSYLGLGVSVTIPTWGNMLANGRDYISDAWWISLFPGLILMFTALSFTLIGDGLRDSIDPRQRDR